MKSTQNLSGMATQTRRSILKDLAAALAALLMLLQAFPALAQEGAPLTLSLSRDFGYSSGAGQIQGAFSMKVSGPDDLARVVFLIDGQPIGEDSQAPFSLQFSTSSYPLGTHTLSAVGYTVDGRELQTNSYAREFVPAEEGMKAAGKIAIPILGVTLAIMLLSIGLPVLMGRGKTAHLPPGAKRNYGPLGGAICPKCSRPFAVHLFGLNLVVGKLDRCPYCGRWSLVRRSPLEVLRLAEAAELEAAGSEGLAPAVSEENRLRKELDDSRFHDI